MPISKSAAIQHRYLLRFRLTSLLTASLGLALIGTMAAQPAMATSTSSVSVSLSASATTVAPGGTIAINGTVNGASGTYISWSVDGVWQGNATVGTIPGLTNSVVYNAPSTPGTHVIKGTSDYNNTVYSTITITVKAPTPAPTPTPAPSSSSNGVSVQLSPASTTVAPGGSVAINGTVNGAAGTYISWSVDGVWQGNSTVGTIPGLTNSVVYYAPQTAGSHVIKGTSDYNNTVYSTTTITVQATTPAPTPTPVAVTLTPSAATVASAGSQAFTAAVTGSSNTAVTWTVDGVAGGNATVGTISGSGATATYTAPAAAGSHTIKATSAADSTKSASSVVTVQAAAPAPTPVVAVAVNPTTATLASGASVAITASVTGSSNTACTWAVDGVANGNATVGTLTGSGATWTYTAPAAAGSHTVTVTSAADPTKSASTAVTVQAPAPVVAVSVNPTSASLNTGATATITASVTGSSNTACTWAVDGVANGNATVGTLTGSGATWTYTAPATAGSHTVTVTSAADSTKSASTAVTVLAPAISVSTSAAASSLNPGGSTTITATVSGSSNTAVTWKVDGVANGNATVGTVTGSGNTVTYTAPSGTGSHTITATSVANSADSSSTAISVVASSGSTAVALAYAGTSSTVNTGGTMLFTASVTGNSNTAVTWSVDGVAAGNSSVGTITGTGSVVLYTAPSATGSHTVTATSAGDGTKSAAKSVTVAATAYTVTNPNSNFNVKTGYGATGNGSTDDTAAIQNAINAASSAGGGLVEVPSGTYMINLGYGGEYGLLMKSNVTLQLDAGSMLKAKTGAPGTSYMIMFNGGSNMNIVGPGTLDGNKSAIGLDESIENIGFWGATNVVLAGFTSQNAPGDGIYIDGYPSGAGVGAPVTNVLIYGVTCTANGRNGMSPDGCNGLVVRDSSFSNQSSANPENGIDCEPINNQAPNNYQIFNCTFANNVGGGIQSGADDTGDNATFTNMTYAFNNVSNCGNYGIEAQDGNGPILILNNTISNTTSSYEFGGYGIMTRGSTGIKSVTIEGNTVSGSHSDGIYISAASGSVCSGNTVTGSAGKGINNQSGSGCTVGSNTESNNTGGN